MPSIKDYWFKGVDSVAQAANNVLSANVTPYVERFRTGVSSTVSKIKETFKNLPKPKPMDPPPDFGVGLGHKHPEKDKEKDGK